MKKKKGFTLVELLAVIVILAVILVIAVPQIMSVIESARKGSIESTAKLIAEGAEREYTNRKILGKDTNIECSDVSSMNSNDYGTCVITFDNRGKATVKVTGKGKFEGYTCNGNSTNMECIKGEIPGSTETAAQYFSYSEVEGGVSITGYLAVGEVNNVVVKDKDKCVAYLQTKFSGLGEENANTICSGGAVDGVTLKDVVQQGGIPSSDYETAGLEVTYKNGGGTDVVIPSMIDGKKVVAIADYAFTANGITPTSIKNKEKASVSYLNNNKKYVAPIPLSRVPVKGLGITSVVIPSAVKSIGESAFENNQLTEVTISGSVANIGNYAFSSNQLTSLTLLDGVTSIGDRAFEHNQLTEVVIPGSVENIGESAFGGNQLTSLTLSNGVKIIGDRAFENNQLTEVVIPKSMENIGRRAFYKDSFSNSDLIKIVNKTGKSFAWERIINDIISSSFITGTVKNSYGNVEVVSE